MAAVVKKNAKADINIFQFSPVLRDKLNLLQQILFYNMRQFSHFFRTSIIRHFSNLKALFQSLGKILSKSVA